MDDPKVFFSFFFPIECNEINSEITQCAPVAWLGVVAHISFKWLKPAKNKLTCSDFTNFFTQISAYSKSFHCWSFRALYIQNLSNRCRRKSISRIFQSNFWRVFDVWHNCVRACVGCNYTAPSRHHPWRALCERTRTRTHAVP